MLLDGFGSTNSETHALPANTRRLGCELAGIGAFEVATHPCRQIVDIFGNTMRADLRRSGAQKITADTRFTDRSS